MNLFVLLGKGLLSKTKAAAPLGANFCLGGSLGRRALTAGSGLKSLGYHSAREAASEEIKASRCMWCLLSVSRSPTAISVQQLLSFIITIDTINIHHHVLHSSSTLSSASLSPTHHPSPPSSPPSSHLLFFLIIKLVAIVTIMMLAWREVFGLR